MCPRRNIQAILEAFLGPVDEPVSPAAFYRVWTFGEAYFKAFGELPAAEILGRVLEHHAWEGMYRVDRPESADVGVLHSEPFDDFSLTIVWELADIAGLPNQTPARLLHDQLGDSGEARLNTALHHGN